jgi:hypothetical protein
MIGRPGEFVKKNFYVGEWGASLRAFVCIGLSSHPHWRLHGRFACVPPAAPARVRAWPSNLTRRSRRRPARFRRAIKKPLSGLFYCSAEAVSAALSYEKTALIQSDPSSTPCFVKARKSGTLDRSCSPGRSGNAVRSGGRLNQQPRADVQ